MSHIKEEYITKTKYCFTHIEDQSKDLARMLDGLERGTGPVKDVDYARALETIGREVKRAGEDLENISYQYYKYLNTSETTGGE